MEIIKAKIDSIIKYALTEDMGDGDVTSNSIIPQDAFYQGYFLAKEPGIIAGMDVAKRTFSLLDGRVEIEPQIADGDKIQEGQIIATIKAPGRSLLSGERVTLNFLQRMSGIATLTNRFVEKVKGTSAVILDTRKTAPGLRVLDKWAVRLGGGQNHRFGLYDMVLIKENHIAAAGGIPEAVMRVRASDYGDKSIEVEVKNLTEFMEAVDLEVDQILLDNMSLDEMTEAVRLCDGRIPLEASGNVTLENVSAIAATGVNFISVGMLTHSVQALDISLLIDKEFSGG